MGAQSTYINSVVNFHVTKSTPQAFDFMRPVDKYVGSKLEIIMKLFLRTVLYKRNFRGNELWSSECELSAVIASLQKNKFMVTFDFQVHIDFQN